MPKNIFIEDIMVRDVASATLPGSRTKFLKFLRTSTFQEFQYLKTLKLWEL